MNRVHKNKNKMAHQYMKICSILIVVEELQIKITMKHIFFPIRLAKSKNSVMLCFRKGMWKQGFPSCVEKGHIGRQHGSSYQNFKCPYPLTQLFHSQECILQIQPEYTGWHKYKDIYCSIDYKSWRLRANIRQKETG